MKRRVAITFTAALLALGLWSMTAYSDEKKERLEAQKAVLKLAESMKSNKGDVKAQVAAIKKKFEELQPLMWVYKKRDKDGIGMGPGGSLDIELTIGKLGNPRSKSKLTPAKLVKLKADLIKVGEISKAVAEISDQYAEYYANKDAPKWKDYTKEMKKAGEELIQAVKSGEVPKVKKAANNLSASCTNCHSDFRE